ncbi:MAG: hypothetical protein ACR2MD_03295 [Aridibacter sp.]|jgi:hypothetical protein|nr:hypothetical protein [Acidobacteriota bacterium]
MGDWIGLLFFLLIPVVILIGLKLLGRKRVSTEQEFEQRASQSGSLLGAGLNALNGMLNPGEAKGKEAITEVKKGRYNKKQGVGKDIGEDFEGE